MITALHGSVGSEKDWESLHIPDQKIDAVNLWQLLADGSLSLSQAGSRVNEGSNSDHAILMGYSMGGRIALHALLENNSRWKKAIIISAHTGLVNKKEQLDRIQLDQSWSQKAMELPWDEFLREWNQQSILSPCDLPDRNHLEPWRKHISQSFIDWSTGQQDNLLDKLADIDIPVLWITGEQDQKFTAIGAKAVEVIPQCESVVIPDSGHRVPWEQPSALRNAICSFL